MTKRRAVTSTTGKKRRAKSDAGVKPGHRLARKITASMSAFLTQMDNVGPRPQAMARALAPRGVRSESSERCVRVFVRSNEDLAEAFPDLAHREGGRVGTVLVPLSRLRSLAEHPAVTRISAPREFRLHMDVAMPLVRVPQFQQQTQSTGRGAIFGLVDSGLDVSHPAFAGRVLSLWDQTMQGSGPGKGFVPMGVVLKGPAMTASLDSVGHGTHVAGIATGAVAPYKGVAPEADIIAVKTNFQNTAVAEAVRWIFSEAARLKRPVVVNLSLGGQGDPHDGSDDLSAALDDEVGPGRIIVVSAGNEGTEAIHATSEITVRKPATISIRVASKSSGQAPDSFHLSGWYSGAGECEVRLTSSTRSEEHTSELQSH